jgi:hypothetical protein
VGRRFDKGLLRKETRGWVVLGLVWFGLVGIEGRRSWRADEAMNSEIPRERRVDGLASSVS